MSQQSEPITGQRFDLWVDGRMVNNSTINQICRDLQQRTAAKFMGSGFAAHYYNAWGVVPNIPWLLWAIEEKLNETKGVFIRFPAPDDPTIPANIYAELEAINCA